MEQEKVMVKAHVLLDENVKMVAELLKVLANQNRLLILDALIEQPMTVGEIGRRVDGITQSALSQHLSVLRAHRILDSEKNGQSITYFISDHRVELIFDVLRDNYCVD